MKLIDTSRICPSCGVAVEKDLSVHIHTCPRCGYTSSRDANDTRNILASVAKSARKRQTGINMADYNEHSPESSHSNGENFHKYASLLSEVNDSLENIDPTNFNTILNSYPDPQENLRQTKIQLLRQPTSEFLGNLVGYLKPPSEERFDQISAVLTPDVFLSNKVFSTDIREALENYNSERAGLQTIPNAAQSSKNIINQEGLGVISSSPAIADVIQKRITDAIDYRLTLSPRKGAFSRDVDILKNAVKNKDNPEWLKQHKEEVDLALRRVFEYGALQWATEGFQITDPTIVQQRIKKLYDVALGNDMLDLRDLDLVYSRFTKQLGLPDREVITDPTTKEQITIKNSTTFEMFQNWMNSKEVPWWHKAALIVGIPLAFAGLLTRIGGGSAGASLLMSGAGLLLSGLGGLFAYNQMRELEAKRIAEQKAKLESLREEQDKYDQQEAEYSRFGFSGKNFFNEFFNLDEKGQPILKANILFGERTDITDTNIQSFLNTAEALGRREEAERILYALSILHNKGEKIEREYLANKEHGSLIDKVFSMGYGPFAPIGAAAENMISEQFLEMSYLKPLKTQKNALLTKLKSFNTVDNISFEEFRRDFKKLLDFAPFEAKIEILENMGYDPVTISSFRYLRQLARRKEIPYEDDNEIFSNLILGKASPEQLYAAIDKNGRNVIIRDATILPRRVLNRTPNRNLGILIARNSWRWKGTYDDKVIMPSILALMQDSMGNYKITYSDLVFLNSLVTDTPTTSTWTGSRPAQVPATTPQEVKARLAGDILNTGLIPLLPYEKNLETYKAIYGEDLSHLSIPVNSLKMFIQIAKNNMDYVDDPRYAVKNLATLMAYDLYKNPKNSVTAAYIDQVILNSDLPEQKKEAVLAQTKDLAVRDPLAAILVLGEFNPMIAEQINDPVIRVPPKSKQAASAVINLLNQPN